MPVSIPADVQDVFHAAGLDLDGLATSLAVPPRTTYVHALKRTEHHPGLAEALAEHVRRTMPAAMRGAQVEVVPHSVLPRTYCINVSAAEKSLDRPHVDHTEGGDLPVVIVDSRCGEAVMRGADVFSPGVMYASKGIEANMDVYVFADDGRKEHPRGSSGIPVEEHLTYLGIGSTAMPRSVMFRHSGSGVALRMVSPAFPAPALHGLRGALGCDEQSLPSILVGDVVGAKPGMRVVDMCAAPGGKTTHIAQDMDGMGLLVACERSGSRCDILRQRLEECDAEWVHVIKGDARVLPELLAKMDPETQAESWAGSFDRVLLDPPCTGLGIRPRLHIKTIHARELDQAAVFQRKLMATASVLVCVGGELVYSTCTANPAENEGNVRHFLDTHHDFELVDATPWIGAPGDRAGIVGDGLLTAEEAARVQRFRPQVTSSTDTAAFFIAKFKRRDTGEANTTS